jgi:2-iminobutanoate/2-iminopropanoate deaminase
MEKIHTPKAPAPAGHYTQAIVHGGLLFASGQLPIDPATGRLVDGGLEVQVSRALENLEQVLVAAGCSKADVLKTTVYIPDIARWGDVNAIYARFFGEHRPARSVVPTRDLHFGAMIEIEAIARVP